MRMVWTRDFLERRIDRCYLVAAWTRVADKRRRYLALARHYRAMFAAVSAGVARAPALHGAAMAPA